jgi:hypothetical protein
MGLYAMIIYKCKICGRLKKIISSKKHGGVDISYTSKKDNLHTCDYIEVKQV